MKKQFTLLIIVLIANLFTFISCKKNSNTPSAKTKTQLITQGSWRLTSATISGGVSVRNYIPGCQQDNIYTFLNGGTGNADEGATKCNTSDPQTNAFTWDFQSNETVLFMSTVLYTNGSSTFNLVSISETELVVDQFVTLVGTVPASVTFTFNH